MPTTMRYAWLKGPQDITVESRPLNTEGLGPHDVCAHTIISALKIGTDRGNFQGPDEGADHFPGAPEYPRYVGDSNCAVITAVGSEVKHFQVGERIVTRWPHQSDYIFDERSGDASDGFAYGVDPEVWPQRLEKLFCATTQCVAVCRRTDLAAGRTAISAACLQCSRFHRVWRQRMRCGRGYGP